MTAIPASTIFALSSAPGRSAVAVIRVSGPQVRAVLQHMVGGVPEPRRAALRTILHPQTRERLDQALVLYFKAPASETGEDLAELQTHGGRAVIAAVLGALGTVPGCRLAGPGEFVRRAFDNGKLDLTAVEGLADLIDAETEAQRRQALGQAAGGLGRLAEGWRARIIEASALVEAAIDFSDEGDVAADAVQQAERAAGLLAADLARHLDDGHRGEILRDGFRVVLAGPPNVGKSSLLNALARRDVAIVSAEAGTTRDVLEVRLDLGGLPVIVTDTAGIREAEGAIEREGIRRTLARAREAGLVIWLMDASAPVATLPEDLRMRADDVLEVLNKIDLTTAGSAGVMPDDIIGISCVTGSGIAELTGRLGAIAAERLGEVCRGEASVITQVRHRQELETAAGALAAFLAASPPDLELRAEELRRAAAALGRLTGRIDVEDVLDQVFGRFCIGK